MYTIRTHQRITQTDLIPRLIRLGYQPEWTAAAPGSFARRGGIVDVFPPEAEPFRIEFTENEIASLHTFDPLKQSLTGERDSVSFPPASVLSLDAEKRVFIARLTPGDFVVHENHGVGRFAGLTTQTIGETIREYFTITYAEEDQLFVPVELAEKLDRYIGPENPSLHRLSSARWDQVTKKIKEDAKRFAQELLKRHAERALFETTPITRTFPEERELAGRWPYELTRDQERSLEESLRDLKSSYPTDRLLVGDVGFGKTEVALRMSFRCVLNDRQVALLAPTTILAQQHFDNFETRLAPFAVSIGLLSRFQTTKEQTETVAKAKRGEIDILIGTTRLLSPDVSLPKLSLLIIDEEQRFGVRQKEALRNLRRDVHTLSLSATPIPRSLNLALSGVRNMSVIAEPPQGRKPIATIVEPITYQRIGEAIDSELKRKGQVYFVHNRVISIERAAEKVRKVAPHARVGVAHGQLPAKDLAAVIRAFDKGNIDVLVTSSIIENGLDLPRVNTLIVEDATQFGLGQLHQLRGRIGRKDVPAVAYFLYDRRNLPEKSKQRLFALEKYAELGSGFELARIDLELRGSGHILSKKQHGHVTAIGLSLYTRLLNQAVTELKCGMMFEPIPDITIDLPITARIDHELEPDEQKRIRLYQKLSMIEDEIELARQSDEILRSAQNDRPLESIKNFFYVLQVKLAARRGGISLVRVTPDNMLTLAKKRSFNFAEKKRLYELDERVTFVENDVIFPQATLTENWRTELIEILKKLAI